MVPRPRTSETVSHPQLTEHEGTWRLGLNVAVEGEQMFAVVKLAVASRSSTAFAAAPTS
jgi:hypothetical protein